MGIFFFSCSCFLSAGVLLGIWGETNALWLQYFCGISFLGYVVSGLILLKRFKQSITK